MVLDAAATDRLLGSWAVTPLDPNQQYSESAAIAGARGEWLYDNDAIGHAIVETLLAGALGPCGLKWSSLYYEAEDGKTTPAEKAVRVKARKSIERATLGKRFDATGVLTRADMSRIMLAQAIQTGDAWSIRQWLPNRPGRQVQATCWRLVHSSRICNPGFGSNTERMFEGIELDENGTPVAIHVMRAHRYAQRITDRFKWTRVAWFDASGHPNVTQLMLHRSPDQLRAPSWFGPVVSLLRMFGSTLTAKVIADRLKASMGLIVECDDPDAAAAADRNGAVLTGTTKIVPGKVYYVRKGTQWKTLDFQYNGQDFGAWADVLLQLVCASFRVPYEFVIQRLTKTNMAASRVALLQAYDTFHGVQEVQTRYVEEPWNASILIEDLARGRLAISGDDEVEAMDRLLAGNYMGPARHMPDPLKEVQTADHWHKRLGKDLSSIYAGQSMDLDSVLSQREQDDELLAARNIQLVGSFGDPSSTPGAVSPASAPNQDGGGDGTTTGDGTTVVDDNAPAAEPATA